jgi:hypothetical protein
VTPSRIALLLACVVLVAGVLWHTYTVRRADDDEVRRQRLEDLRGYVAAVDNQAMSASFGLLSSYDELVRAIDALRTHTRELVVAARGRPDHPALQLVLDRVEERTTHVEELKQLRSTLTNSERLLRERLEGDDHSPAVAELKRHLLAHSLVPNDAKSLEALEDLKKVLEKEPAGRELVPHLKVVLNAGRVLANLTKGLLARHKDSLSELARERARVQHAELERHRRQANHGRLASLSLALLLVVAALWLPDRRRPGG